MRARASLFVSLFTCLALSGGAAAYDQRVHAELSAHSYAGPRAPLARAGAAPDALALTARLRERLWRAGAGAKDPELRLRFLARYPSLARLDAWEMKRLFALNPEQSVAGFDETPLPAGDNPAAVYALASRLPDDDHRNRDRFRHDAARHLVLGPCAPGSDGRDGQPLPDDPATLDMGGLTGLSSQAHAHYGLPKLAFSDDPRVLKEDPRRFAVPPSVKTFGADFADAYTALAILSFRLPHGDRLALTHAGAAAHHIEDVANQIHTVQVGLYAFFVDAKLESIKEELRSVGGFLRPRPTFISIGIDIIANHHTLAEALYAKHFLTPGDPVAGLTERTPPDPDFAAALARLPAGCAPGFARTLTETLIERSSYEGAAVYQAMRDAALPRLSKVGQRFEEIDDPDAAIRPAAELGSLYTLEARGVRRAHQALAAWWSHFEVCRASPSLEPAIAEALIAARLDALDAAEARAISFVPRPPMKQSINYFVPGGYLFTLALLLGLVRRLRRRR